MTITLDRGPQQVGDLLKQLNDLRAQVNALGSLIAFNDGSSTGVSVENVAGDAIINMYGDDSFSEIDMLAGSDADKVGYFFLDADFLHMGTFGGPKLLIDYTDGVNFADVPAVPNLGMTMVIRNSNTTTWGATIAAASPGAPVLAFYNGTNWTVVAK